MMRHSVEKGRLTSEWLENSFLRIYVVVSIPMVKCHIQYQLGDQGEKGLFQFTTLCISEESKRMIWSQEIVRWNWSLLLAWYLMPWSPCFLRTLGSAYVWHHSQWAASPTWHESLFTKIPRIITCRPFLWRHFFNWSCLFLKGSSWLIMLTEH